jgi:hypothetical protein
MDINIVILNANVHVETNCTKRKMIIRLFINVVYAGDTSDVIRLDVHQTTSRRHADLPKIIITNNSNNIFSNLR